MEFVVRAQVFDFLGQHRAFIIINVAIGPGRHDHCLKYFQPALFLGAALELFQWLAFLGVVCWRCSLTGRLRLVVLIGLPGQNANAGQGAVF